MINKTTLLLASLLFVAGCSKLSPQKEESAFIVWKTPKMKYADMGFISSSDSLVKVSIYGAGQPLVSWEINGMNVCMSTFKCLEKKDFNAEFLSSTYPDSILENIFKGKTIFNKEGYSVVDGGFKQSIQRDSLSNISYSVINGERIFRDKENKILIKVREQ